MSQTTKCIHAFLERIDADHSRRAYRSDLRDFVDALDNRKEDWSIDRVTKQEIQRYMRTLDARGLALSTRRRRLSTLRRFFDWLIGEQIVEHNPARSCTVDLSASADPDADGNDRSSSALTTDQVQSLVRAANTSGEAAVRDRALIITILYAALRRAEVAAMDVEHIRPLGRHWVIDVPADDEWSSAYVKVADPVVEAIDAVQDRYDITKGPIWRSLSNRNRGSRLTPDAIYKIVRRTGRRAGIQNVTVERLRQTGLHLAWTGGASMHHVREHARVQSVQAIERYAGMDDSRGRLNESAVDFLDLDI